MKKRIIAALVCVATALTLTGCSKITSVNVNVEKGGAISGNVFGKSTLIEIGDGLYYDATTRIVYWWNGIFSFGNNSTMPSPYYAPNGLPYRYNPETNAFEEIREEIRYDT